jgi:hypothetical protein
MEKVFDVDFHVTWTAPVFIRIGDGRLERVEGPNAALTALLDRWPPTSQREIGLAKQNCVGASARHGTSELARSSFVDAAVAARVLA